MSGIARVVMAAWAGLVAIATSQELPPFAVEVVDAQTQRGVPLVELRTTANQSYWTDSNGLVAFREPGWMKRRVFFHVASHGYRFPKDGFGYAGQVVEVKPGGQVRLEIERINLAERLYRVTGQGIYRDSVLLDRPVPITRPLSNAQVAGSDSVLATLYRGRVHWFWGDTNRIRYPLGNFHVPGATSRLPQDGGLLPAKGIDLEYFVDAEGFAAKTAELPADGPTWLSGLTTLDGDDGESQMWAHYAKIRGTTDAFDVYDRGVVRWRDDEKRFAKVAAFAEKEPFNGGGHPLRVRDGERDFVYFADPFPLLRVPATVGAYQSQAAYEAWSPLLEGERDPLGALDRDAAGALRYAWKRNTAPLRPVEQARRVHAGEMEEGEGWWQLFDVETGKRVIGHRGTVAWNDHRQRYVMIAVEVFGTSMLGEVWFAEADQPLGPWGPARKIVTHDQMSFYNPKHHPFFDDDGGRVIYFEGTYTKSFSGNPVPTPWYEYNQVMYRLDLSDPRLTLPVAVYEIGSGDAVGWATGPTAAANPEARPRFWAYEEEAPDTAPMRVHEGRQVGHAQRGAEASAAFWARRANGESAGRIVPISTILPGRSITTESAFVWRLQRETHVEDGE